MSTVALNAGFHYYRAELDAGVAGDPEQAHARRGAHWTFDAPAFVACVRSLKGAGGGQAAGGSARSGDGAEPHDDDEEAAVAVPSFAHGVGDPVPGDIRVAARHRVLLVEGNYLLLGEALTQLHFRSRLPHASELYHSVHDVSLGRAR